MEKIKELICPICHKQNNCMVNETNTDCWCMTVSINANVLQLVHETMKVKQCICKNCIDKYN